MAARGNEAVEMWKCRRLARSKIGEEDSAFLDHRVGFLLDVGAKIAVDGLGRGVEPFSGEVKQPAVKSAAQATVFKPAISEVGSAVRTAAADQAVTATLVLEDHQILGEQAARLDWPVA